MNIYRVLGYILYAIGIVGAAEGVIKESISISAISLIVIVLGSVLLGLKQSE